MSRVPALPLTTAQALRRTCQRMLRAHRKRAAAEGKVLDYGLEQLLQLAHEKRTCLYCLLPVGLDFQLDHLDPIARGGPHTLLNLEVVCPRCNKLKGMLTRPEFEALRLLLKALHPVASEDLCRRLLAGGGAAYARHRRKGF